MELRSPRDTEAEAAVAEAAADEVRAAAVALRRAAVDGDAEPGAAAQQTGRAGRASRGSCGVCKWARGVVSTAIPILAPLPNIA